MTKAIVDIHLNGNLRLSNFLHEPGHMHKRFGDVVGGGVQNNFRALVFECIDKVG